MNIFDRCRMQPKDVPGRMLCKLNKELYEMQSFIAFEGEKELDRSNAVKKFVRVGEITGLRWQDVDFEKGSINVNHTLVYYNHRDERGTYFGINTPKTKAGCREIPMISGVKEAFELEREYQRELGIESKSRIDGYENFVFVNQYGNVQHHGTLNRAIKRVIRDCNDRVLLENDLETKPVLLPDFSCHNLRHTFATRLCESGINIKVIQSVLGHVDISTTMDIYVDVMSETKKRELAQFDDYMQQTRQ